MVGVSSRILAKTWIPVRLDRLVLNVDEMHADVTFSNSRFPKPRLTFHGSFEEDFAAAAGQDAVVAAGGLVRADQAELGRWSRRRRGCGWRGAYIWSQPGARKTHQNIFNWDLQDTGKHSWKKWIAPIIKYHSSARKVHQTLKQLNNGFCKTYVKLHGFFMAYLARSGLLPWLISKAKSLHNYPGLLKHALIPYSFHYCHIPAVCTESHRSCPSSIATDDTGILLCKKMSKLSHMFTYI